MSPLGSTVALDIYQVYLVVNVSEQISTKVFSVKRTKFDAVRREAQQNL